jgi:hypothetical protein
MAESDLGTATIVYDHPEDGTVEESVQNKHIAYFQDHWLLKRDEDEAGNDLVRRIPVERVHYVDRNVEAFEDEVSTVRKQVENVANDIRSKLLGGNDNGHGERAEAPADHDTTESDDPVQIDVTEDSDDED